MNKRLFILALSAAGPLLSLSACSSAPHSQGYQGFYGATDALHREIRRMDAEEHKGRFPTTQTFLDRIERRFEKEDCYRITSSVHQWRTLEPEILFYGESVFKPGHRILIAVPPLLEERQPFLTPNDEGLLRVFRLDQDAGHGPELIQRLTTIVGRRDDCVKVLRVEEASDMNLQHALLSARFYPVGEAPPPKKTPHKTPSKSR